MNFDEIFTEPLAENADLLKPGPRFFHELAATVSFAFPSKTYMIDIRYICEACERIMSNIRSCSYFICLGTRLQLT
jgi:hypothetical protein